MLLFRWWDPPCDDGDANAESDTDDGNCNCSGVLVIGGYEHVYERIESDGIPYFVNKIGDQSF